MITGLADASKEGMKCHDRARENREEATGTQGTRTAEEVLSIILSRGVSIIVTTLNTVRSAGSNIDWWFLSGPGGNL